MARNVRTRDGRVLAYEQFGDPDGKPVIALHGTPGSRVGPFPREARLHPLGVRIIAYDRPGYGESARAPGRVVADAAVDVEDLANELGIERFAVVGRSGGGPHALACAARLPERVTRVAILASPAPKDVMGARWYNDMAEENADWYRKAELGEEEFRESCGEEMERRRRDPESVMPHNHSTLPKTDHPAALDFGVRSKLVDTFSEALNNGIDGWVEDVLAFVSPWGFGLAQLRAPVLIWHGLDDVLSPIGHLRCLQRQLAGVDPEPEVRLKKDKAHLSAIYAFPALLPWLCYGSRAE